MATDGMLHLNGNILCAIDIETTGLRPGFHDIIQICILPLDSDIKPNKRYNPFYMNLIPKRPENIDYAAMDVHKVKMAEIINTGMDPDKAVDIFEEWFKKFNLNFGKKISPLAQNWPFDRGFIMDWIGGPLNFEHFFDGRYRDTMVAALYANDKSYFQGEAYPFQKVNLTYLALEMKIKRDKAHDALSDCITTAEIYRRMLGALHE